MIRRLALVLMVVAGSAGFAVLAGGAGGDDGGKRYWVELDNAFGLIEGADVKIAGVRAGKITAMKLDREDMRALIGIRVDQTGFDDIRTDVHCEARPQSLIGEYFLDCQPGTDRKRLPEGATIPVEQTASTIPLDLINNIMRRPYRERFTILFSEFGAALAARGGDLNEVIRRANPALRETDKVLATLAEHKEIIRDLYRDADRVLAELARDRGEVTRFVSEARDTAATYAPRSEQIRRQWATFPTFLRELRPTMARLGATADAQRPALERLNVSAERLETFFRTVGPFSEASRPAFRTLAAAARTGRRAVRSARPNVAQLRETVDSLPQAADNLAITLEHLHDPKFRPEADERAGRGKDGGFTGFETWLRYFFSQSQAINVYDANSYMLKAQVFYDRDCANYADEEVVRKHTEDQARRCRAWVGPNQPGVTSPDFTETGKAAAGRSRTASGDGRTATADPAATGSGSGTAVSGSAEGGGSARRSLTLSDTVGKVLDGVLGGKSPATPAAPAVPQVRSPETTRSLLDFLLR